MKIFHLNIWGAAIIFALLVMGLLGLLVVLPIVCIQWVWNAFVSNVAPLPSINIWQAGLLYLAFGTLFYLLGFVQIEFETSS